MSKDTKEPEAESPQAEDQENKLPTPEELKKQKAELMKFYKGELPLLRLQAEYEECITRIDMAKMQRFEIMMAKAQMMAPPPDGDQTAPNPMEASGEHRRPENPGSEPEKKERKLKSV